MRNQTIGMTFGVFDLFHVGHLALLNNCKTKCDKLIVGVLDDDYVINEKHHIPIYDANDRLAIIRSLKCVDDAILVTTEMLENRVELMNQLNSTILFSGSDWKNTNRFEQLKTKCDIAGISIEFFDYTTRISTTLIKNKINQISASQSN